jgi:membrane protein required for colicin V production
MLRFIVIFLKSIKQNTMAIIDIILGALILYGLIKGLSKGFFVEVTSLLALLVGVYGAVHFSNYAAEFLSNRFEWGEKTINITAFAITFVAIVFAISLAGKALTKLADFAALGVLNKLLGGLFGGLKIALILSILVLIFNTLNKTIPFVSDEEIESSLLYNPVKSLAPMIFPNFINEDTPLKLPDGLTLPEDSE